MSQGWGITMSQADKILTNVVDSLEVDAEVKKSLLLGLQSGFAEHVSYELLKSKLDVLFEYERNYLGLVKEFKEEIKFAASIQEDLRKERSKFFSETLKEVSGALKDAQVDDVVAAKWIKELVGSYTKSLDLSSGLIEESTQDTIGEIKERAKRIKPDLSNVDGKDE